MAPHRFTAHIIFETFKLISVIFDTKSERFVPNTSVDFIFPNSYLLCITMVTTFAKKLQEQEKVFKITFLDGRQ